MYAARQHRRLEDVLSWTQVSWRGAVPDLLARPSQEAREVLMRSEQPPEKKPGPVEIPEPPDPRRSPEWNPDREPRIPPRPMDRGRV